MAETSPQRLEIIDQKLKRLQFKPKKISYQDYLQYLLYANKKFNLGYNQRDIMDFVMKYKGKLMSGRGYIKYYDIA